MRTRYGLLGPLVLAGMLAIDLCAQPAQAAVAAPRAVETGSVIVTAGEADVREAPSPRAKVIAVINKGEVFPKHGRTGRWYYIKLEEDSFGWVSGRDIRRYRAPSQRAPYTGRTGDRQDPYYPYYPDDYYGYPYYWERPYLSWEWYLYDYAPYRDRSYYYRDDHRYRDRPRVDTWRDDRGYRGYDSRRRGDTRRRSGPDHLPVPRFRVPFQRR